MAFCRLWVAEPFSGAATQHPPGQSWVLLHLEGMMQKHSVLPEARKLVAEEGFGG